MRFEDTATHLGDIPYSWPETGRVLYDLVVEFGLVDMLDLGTAHGVSAGYLAAAAQETGGHVTTVDLATRAWEPPVEEVIGERLGLADFVTIVREPTSYTWFLKSEIERRTVDGGCKPRFDLCFLDGAKHWTTDGLAFFLVDKLLRPGGWMVFDDLDWTFEGSGRESSDGISVRAMSPEERCVPHVRLIVDLLVRQHADYRVDAVLEGRLAVAQKR